MISTASRLCLLSTKTLELWFSPRWLLRCSWYLHYQLLYFVPWKKSTADRFTGYSLPEKLVKVKKRDNIFDLPQHAFEPKTQKQYLGYFREVFSLDKIFEKAKKSLKLFHFETIENQVKARYDWWNRALWNRNQDSFFVSGLYFPWIEAKIMLLSWSRAFSLSLV